MVIWPHNKDVIAYFKIFVLHLTNDNPFSISKHIIIGTSESEKRNKIYIQPNIYNLSIIPNVLQINNIIDGTPAPSSLPDNTINHWTGSTLIPYLQFEMKIIFVEDLSVQSIKICALRMQQIIVLLEKVLQQQSKAAHCQQQEAPVDQASEIVETGTP